MDNHNLENQLSEMRKLVEQLKDDTLKYRTATAILKSRIEAVSRLEPDSFGRNPAEQGLVYLDTILWHLIHKKYDDLDIKWALERLNLEENSSD